jgi:hypothetical protein
VGPISVNPSNLVQGPAILYIAPYGTAEPTDASVTPDGYLTIPPSPWTDVGSTESGIVFDVDHTITPQEVDQLIDPAGGRLTKRVVTITATLAEATLQNLNYVTNGILNVDALGGYTTADPNTATSATQPNYYMLMIYGWGPLLQTGRPALRRITVRKVLSQVKASLDYEMTKYATYAVTWTAFYVSAYVPLFHIVEADV